MSETPTPAGTPAQPAAPKERGKRTHLLLVMLVVVVAASGAYGAWWHLYAQFEEHTDDAYVGGNIVQITPQVAGSVVAVLADDTERVEAGRPLVRLDPADTRVALDQAEADLARAVRDVRQLFASEAAAAATVAQREAEFSRARADLSRRREVRRSGGVPEEEVKHAEDTVRAQEAALQAAREAQAAQKVLIDGTTVEQHPSVRKAAAKVREAYLAWERTAIVAPVSGFVAKRSAQVGQRVAPGTALMAVIPLDGVWVDANFKEGQLRHMRIGQPVAITADLYGSGITYHGRVAGFSPGTGAAFALLPPQNATGNWIKVVQRLPVRIELDRSELAQNPLLVGLSMVARVDTRDRGGMRLAAAPRQDPLATTDVYAGQLAAAEGRVNALLAAGLKGAALPVLEAQR